MLLLVRPVNKKTSINFNQMCTGSSPRTEQALQARASSEIPTLSFHRRSKNFVELQVVQSTSNFLLYSALKSFLAQMLQGNKSSEEWLYISPTMVLPFNEQRQIACEIGWLVGYSLKCLTHPSHNTMGSTAHFFCLHFPSQHSQTISISRPFSSCSSPLKEKSIWPKAAEIMKGPEKANFGKQQL